jgi:hypothetical protein
VSDSKHKAFGPSAAPELRCDRCVEVQVPDVGTILCRCCRKKGHDSGLKCDKIVCPPADAKESA